MAQRIHIHLFVNPIVTGTLDSPGKQVIRFKVIVTQFNIQNKMKKS